MTSDIEQFIDSAAYSQRDIRVLASMLPTDDTLIDTWIEKAVHTGNAHQFQCLIAAALHAGRNVDARHLEAGTIMAAGTNALGCMAYKMQGDVPGFLMKAVTTERLLPLAEATALYVAAAYCKRFRDGQFPPDLVPATRRCARDPALPRESFMILYGIAGMTRDPQLIELLAHVTKIDTKLITDEALDYLGNNHHKICEGPFIDTVPATVLNVIAMGSTMRRSVEKTGRNEPCPCGSGKKYKQCCLGKDMERLKRSSDIPGTTVDERDREPERYMTRDRMRHLPFPETARLDVSKLPEELWPEFFVKVGGFGYLREALDSLYKLPRTAITWMHCWSQMSYWVTRAGRKDLLQELVDVLPERYGGQEAMVLEARLLLAEDDPAKCWAVLNEAALETLREEPKSLKSFAGSLMLTKQTYALGILVARGVIPIEDTREAGQLMKDILATRDKLNLPPEDPFSEVLDARLTERSNRDGGVKLATAQRKLEAKSAEVRELKEALHEITRQIELREKRAAEVTPQTSTEKVDEKEVSDLRRKVDNLKTALKERHYERNELRRELQQAHEQVEELQTRKIEAPSSMQDKEEAEEETLFVPAEENIQQPIRLIEFPKKFDETLNGYPRHAARAAMTMIGRLAAGDPPAFVGVVKLKQCPNLLRVRIGSDYRLLFRVTESQVQVVDFINRKDLLRRLKTIV